MMCPMNFVGQAHCCQIDNKQGNDQETEFDLIPLVLAVDKPQITARVGYHNIVFHGFPKALGKGFCLKMV